MLILNIDVQHVTYVDSSDESRLDNLNVHIAPVGIEHEHDFAPYEKENLPKLPLTTNRDMIAPPREAVKIICPQCPVHWE